MSEPRRRSSAQVNSAILRTVSRAGQMASVDEAERNTIQDALLWANGATGTRLEKLLANAEATPAPAETPATS